MPDTAHSSEEHEAAQAFEVLQAEVAQLSTAIGQLSREWQRRAPPDYSVSLGQITKKLTQLSTQLGEIEQHPALAMTPAIYQQIIAESGGVVMRESVNRFDHATQWAERVQRELTTTIGAARRRGQQRKWLLITTVVALLAGFLSAIFVARWLPLELESRMAAPVMGMDRWNAGSAMMELESPEGWREVLSAMALWKANRAEIKACREAASKTHKPEHCAIIASGFKHLK